MPWLIRAIDPLFVQQQFDQCLPFALKQAQLCEVRVIRYKPGRRCLIEYDVKVNDAANHTAIDSDSQTITLIGKVRAKGIDTNSYQLQQALWNTGFSEKSEDDISVPEPIAIIPNLQMWLQQKVPGTIATHLLPQPGGIALAQRIAEAVHKLHSANIPPRRRHTMTDELNILRDRLTQVMQQYPQWETRLERLLDACYRLGAATPKPNSCGIHRDFYPDQIIVSGSRLYLLDLDLYCEGDPSLDIGNFIGHLIEQGIRTFGNADALQDRSIALEETFVQLSGTATRAAIRAYTALTLVRHIFLSQQFVERRPFTEQILQCSEQLLL
ncbi:phosphotransferase [Leptolyngbya ohadii]|uniref:phosphotransferase n=1 Tax=Leptolyngbya ohadii TaxID=1962290 RepID=UPI000B59AE6F|nr:phosphotransferase [Leptolyngbya ohadii]